MKRRTKRRTEQSFCFQLSIRKNFKAGSRPGLPVARVLLDEIPINHLPKIVQVLLFVILVIRKIAMLPKIDPQNRCDINKVGVFFLSWLPSRKAVSQGRKKFLFGGVVVLALEMGVVQILFKGALLFSVSINAVHSLRNERGSGIEKGQDLQAAFLVFNEPNPPIPEKGKGFLVKLVSSRKRLGTNFLDNNTACSRGRRGRRRSRAAEKRV